MRQKKRRINQGRLLWSFFCFLGFVARSACRNRAPRLSYATPVPRGKALWFYTVRTQVGNGYIDCGGSLIAPDIVLTAAHCVYFSAAPDGVFLVDPRAEVEIEGIHGVAIAVPDVWKSAERIDFSGDLAVVKLNKQVGANVETVELARVGWASKSVTIFGRGLTEDGVNSKTLEYIVVPVIPDEEATVLLEQAIVQGGDDEMAKGRKKLPEQGFSTLEADHFGAGDLKKDSCQGDSGGPALSKFDRKGRRDVLVGVVSYGPSFFECGEQGSFGLYTDVGTHEKWLASALDGSIRWEMLIRSKRILKSTAQV